MEKKRISIEDKDGNSVQSGDIRAGDTITWEIKIKNNTEWDKKISLKDVLDNGENLTLTKDGKEVKELTIPAGQEVSGLTASYTVTEGDEGTKLTNKVTATDINDKEYEGSDDGTDIPVPGPDLTVRKNRTSAEKAAEGDTIKWDIIITNNTRNEKEVTISDVLSNKQTLELKDEDGKAIGDTLSISAGESIVLKAEYTIKADDEGKLFNTVVVKDKDEDYKAEDGGTTINNPAISVSKTPEKTEYKAGETIKWEVSVTNNGDSRLDGLKLKDTLKINDEAEGNKVVLYKYGVLFDPEKDDFTVDVNGKAIFTAVFEKADAGVYENSITVSYKDKDLCTADSAPVTVTDDHKKQLQIKKEADRTSGIKIGETITFTITVHNQSQKDINDAEIRDVLPKGLMFKLAKLTVGANDAEEIKDYNGVIKVSLKAGEKAVLKIEAKAEEAGTITNTASIYQQGKDLPDNSSSVTCTVDPNPEEPGHGSDSEDKNDDKNDDKSSGGGNEDGGSSTASSDGNSKNAQPITAAAVSQPVPIQVDNTIPVVEQQAAKPGVNTRDNNHILIWTTLLVMACAAFAVVFAGKNGHNKKSSNKKRS